MTAPLDTCDPCHGAGSPSTSAAWSTSVTLGRVPEPVIVEFLPTLPALAKAIGDWMPELGGRSIAVSEAENSPQNVPTLPLVMVALQRETADQSVKTNSNIMITEDILVQYWVKPSRYLRADKSESPFWSFYDYSRIRDRLLGLTFRWISPRGKRLRYINLDIECDQQAVVLTFRFDHTFTWCPPDPDGTPPCEAPEACTLSWCIAPGPPG